MSAEGAPGPAPPGALRRALALTAACMVGAAVAAVAMPALFRATPTDVSRIGALLEALDDPSFAPEIAVLGNSVLMSGIDARQLRNELPGEPLAVNLASTGQSLVESYLLQQEIPPSVRTVVQQVNRIVTRHDHAPLDANKYNTFYLNGFRPEPLTTQTLGRIYGRRVTDLLERTNLEQRFAGRWALRQLVDTRLRVLLRRDLDLSGAEFDLYHPQRYTAPIGAKRLAWQIEDWWSGQAQEGISVSSEDVELLSAMAEHLAGVGARLVILSPPIHPDILDLMGAEIFDELARVRAELDPRGRFGWVDATQALGASQFIDMLHPTNEGAEIVTHLVATELARLH